MDRRAFIGTLAGGLLAAPLPAEAQQVGKSADVGYLSTGERSGPLGNVFKEALGELGWVEGQNLAIEYRFGGDRYEQLTALAADLVRIKVDVIFAASAPAAQAAKAATSTIPIVFHTLNDPVRAGLVASFARPGGNMTGNAGLGPELDRKRFELLKELVPSLSLAAVLVNPANPMTPHRLAVIGKAAQTLGVEVLVVRASDVKELDTALKATVRAKPGGLIVFEDPVFSVHRLRIIDFTRIQKLTVVYTQTGWAEQGGLIEYAPDQREMYRQAAAYVDRILRGAKPSNLPIEQPTKFELVINLKTAKTLGLTIPPSLLQRADQVIE